MFRCCFLAFASLLPLACAALAEGNGVGSTKVALTLAPAQTQQGIVIEMPDQMPCDQVRFRLSGGARPVVSLPLLAGQLAVLRIPAAALPAGATITLQALGCAVRPNLVFQLRLRAASPSHAARAARTQGLIQLARMTAANGKG